MLFFQEAPKNIKDIHAVKKEMHTFEVYVRMKNLFRRQGLHKKNQ